MFLKEFRAEKNVSGRSQSWMDFLTLPKEICLQWQVFAKNISLTSQYGDRSLFKVCQWRLSPALSLPEKAKNIFSIRHILWCKNWIIFGTHVRIYLKQITVVFFEKKPLQSWYENNLILIRQQCHPKCRLQCPHMFRSQIEITRTLNTMSTLASSEGALPSQSCYLQLM